jgi:hypothetical protein
MSLTGGRQKYTSSGTSDCAKKFTPLLPTCGHLGKIFSQRVLLREANASNVGLQSNCRNTSYRHALDTGPFVCVLL